MRFVRVLTAAFWLWSALIASAGGLIGAALACEGGDGCKAGSPSWLTPWTWVDYYVYPEATIVGALGLIGASVFAVLVWTGRKRAAAAALVPSVWLLTYPYFGGLTDQGRGTLVYGPLLALIAVARLRQPAA